MTSQGLSQRSATCARYIHTHRSINRRHVYTPDLTDVSVRQTLWEGAAGRKLAGLDPCDVAWTALKDSAPA